MRKWSREASQRWREKFKARNGVDYSTWYWRKNRSPEVKRCRYCKQTFTAKRRDRPTCCYDPDCTRRWNCDRIKAARKKRKAPPKPKRKYQCSECFRYKETYRPDAVTCSPKCKQARRKRMQR